MSDAVLHVGRANPLLTVQDQGRQGAMRYGVSPSGAMDWVRFRHALTLAGAGTTAAFEIGIAGAQFRAEREISVAFTGEGFRAVIDGAEPRIVTPPARLTLGDGETLAIEPGSGGMWAYLAVPQLDFGAPVLGSFATNARTGLGARDFARGFPVRQRQPLPTLLAADITLSEGPIGLLPGPQTHLFAQAAQETLTSATYRLTAEVDRMGYKLEGPPLHARTHDIISDGIVEGAIQVPGNGQPIVLCADRAPTGGYPKIAVIASADRPRLIQSRPGTEHTFRFLTLEEAHRRRRAVMDALAAPPTPRVRAEFDTEFLAGINLIDGVVHARDPHAPER